MAALTPIARSQSIRVIGVRPGAALLVPRQRREEAIGLLLVSADGQLQRGVVGRTAVQLPIAKAVHTAHEDRALIGAHRLHVGAPVANGKSDPGPVAMGTVDHPHVVQAHLPGSKLDVHDFGFVVVHLDHLPAGEQVVRRKSIPCG